MKKIIKLTICLFMVIILSFLGFSNKVKVEAADDIEVLSTKSSEDGEEKVNIEFADSNDFSNMYYIENANYFIVNPKHSKNSKSDNSLGTCTTVAAQLLLGYHNYYSDRRLIPEYKDSTTRFLSDDYGDLLKSPEYDDSITSAYGRSSIGTEDEVFKELMNLNSLSGIPGIGQILGNVVKETIKFCEKYSKDINSNISISKSNFSYDDVIADLNAGLPVLLTFNPLSSGLDNWHSVVAYGYAKYKDVDGFIVHYGWQHDNTHIWIPSSLIGYQVRMSINHTHIFESVPTNIIDNHLIEIKCTECGYRKTDELYKIRYNELLAVNYQLPKTVTIPTKINYSKITSIGYGAFSNQGDLEKVIIPETITSIGNNAFIDCTKLSEVIVKKEDENITKIGTKVFDGCSSSLQIIVPTNRIVTYINNTYWKIYRTKIIPSSEYDNLSINCKANLNIEKSKDQKSSILYQLNVECAKTYRFISDKNVTIDLYDENMNSITYGFSSLDWYLSIGNYYVLLELKKIESDNVHLTIAPLYNSSMVKLNEGDNNIKTNVHNTIDSNSHGEFYFNTNMGGLYSIKLTTSVSNIPSSSIIIYSDSSKTNVIKRHENSNNLAENYNNEKEMFVYFEKNTNYYIDILVPTATTLILTIENVETNELDFSNQLTSTTLDELFGYTTTFSHYEEVTISHLSYIELDIMTTGTISKDILVYIFEKNENDMSLKLEESITSVERCPVFSIILNPGIYYVGFEDNSNSVNVLFSIKRKVNSEVTWNSRLITDPSISDGYSVGTEVRMNNGELLGTTITEGFTRNIYFMVNDRLEESISRLDYAWYTSNNSAIVSDYGTVLALNVEKDTFVKVYAVLKDDPRIVYSIELTVLKETKTEEIIIECNMSYIYDTKNGLYQLQLTFENSPYPYIKYYEFEVIDSGLIDVTIDLYGRVTSTGVGSAIINGTYVLNERVKLVIHLSIE